MKWSISRRAGGNGRLDFHKLLKWAMDAKGRQSMLTTLPTCQRLQLQRCGLNLCGPLLRAELLIIVQASATMAAGPSWEVHLDNANGFTAVFLREVQWASASSGSIVSAKTQNHLFVFTAKIFNVYVCVCVMEVGAWGSGTGLDFILQATFLSTALSRPPGPE